MLWRDKVALEAITDMEITGVVGGRAHIGGTTVAPAWMRQSVVMVFLIKGTMWTACRKCGIR